MSISSGSKILASDVNSHINNKSNPHAVTASQIGGLAAVATTGSYNDLKDKPSEEAFTEVWSNAITITGTGSSTRTFNLGLKPLAVMYGSHIGGDHVYYLGCFGQSDLFTPIPIVGLSDQISALNDPNNCLKDYFPSTAVWFYHDGTNENNYPDAITITDSGFSVKYGTNGPCGNWGTNNSRSQYTYWYRIS